MILELSRLWTPQRIIVEIVIKPVNCVMALALTPVKSVTLLISCQEIHV